MNAKRESSLAKDARRDRSLALLALPGLAGLAVFVVGPLLMSLGLSFSNERLLPRPIETSWVGFGNYGRVLADSEFWQAVANTLVFAVMVVPTQIALALGVALLLNSRIKGQWLWRSIAILPLLLPITVVCALWAALLQTPDGLLNSAWQALFATSGHIDWLGDADTALLSIALLSIWATFPFQALIYLAGLQEIPRHHREVAAIEGFSAWQEFRHITVPGLAKTHVFVIVVTTIGALGLFAQVNVLTGGGPNGATSTIIHYLYERGFAAQQIGLAAAVAVVFFIGVAAIGLAQRALLSRA